MADLKKHMTRHLRSARQWLTRAEESFDKERDVRGQLDLMLAQAELQHARESGSKGKRQVRFQLLRHGVAFGMATLVAVLGVGGSYMLMANQQPAPTAPHAVPQTTSVVPVLEAKNVLETAQVTPVKKNAGAEQPAAVAASPSAMETTNSADLITPNRQKTDYEQRHTVVSAPPQEKAVDLPPDEMQKLMRAAGKSLRGQ